MMVGRGILTGMRRDSFPEKGVFDGFSRKNIRGIFFPARFFFLKGGFREGFHPDSAENSHFGAQSYVLMPYPMMKNV
jgi:hypothetical protein